MFFHLVLMTKAIITQKPCQRKRDDFFKKKNGGFKDLSDRII